MAAPIDDDALGGARRSVSSERIAAAKELYLTELRRVSPGQSERWYQGQMERQPMFQNPEKYHFAFPPEAAKETS